jgi:hypothetical protein
MAKKPKGKPAMIATETETEMKVVRLELPLVTHKAFRVAAAEEGVSMALLARKAVEEYLENRKGS